MGFSPPWLCDNCGRANGITRYQCQQCRGINTYDLCDQCIINAHTTHPFHSFKLVQSGGTAMSASYWTPGTYGNNYWPTAVQYPFSG
ncbi:hypothetical protein I4U23_012106 [Adineta vaga]|nr:hypothetical protein I4U23_012106 [Adineta vaga]